MPGPLPGLLIGLLVAPLLLGGCGLGPGAVPGNDETDRIALVVSTAISYPHQASAMDYARVAAGTRAGLDDRLSVVGVSDRTAATPTDPFGEVILRVHLDGAESGFSTTPPVTACYRAEVGAYGVVGAPDRVDCPAGATPVSIPAAPSPPPALLVPPQAERVLRAHLGRLGRTPVAARLTATLAARLPVAAPAVPPDVEAVTDGADVGVSIRGDDACLLGRRTAGAVEVWRLSAVQRQPGELSCDPDTALGGVGQEQPH